MSHKKINVYFLWIVFFFLLTGSNYRTSAQISPELLKTYTEKYKKHNTLVKECITTITFDITEPNVTVKEECNIKIVALKASTSHTFRIFYDEHTTIDRTSKSLKVCGDYHPEGIFHSDQKLCTFTLDFERSGEEKTFSYVRKFDDARFFPSIYFTKGEPTLKSTVRIIVPKELDIDIKDFNTEEYSFKAVKQSSSGETTLEYTCENIPGYENETNMPDYDFIWPHLLPVPKSYKINNTNQPIFGSLTDFYAWCNNLACKASIEGSSVKAQVTKLTEGKKTDIEKVKAIYYWVQDNIRYIAFEEGLAGYIPDNAEKVFTQKYGDCKGMANLLKSMLKMAGFDARLTWIGTRSTRYNFSTPVLASCNHMICTLVLNGKNYFLDATDTYNPFGVFPGHLQGRQVLIENGSKFILDSIPFSPIEDNLVLNKYNYTISNDLLKGQCQMEFNGEIKSSLLHGLNNGRTDDRNLFLEKIITRDKPTISVSNIIPSDIKKREELFSIQGDVSVKGQINTFDNELYVIPDPFNDLSEMITTSDRISPLYFSKRNNRKTEVQLTIPQGYTLQKLPENFILSNDIYNFEIKYKTLNTNTILYTKQLKILTDLIPKKRLPEWNNAVKQLKKAYSQPIIFQKK